MADESEGYIALAEDKKKKELAKKELANLEKMETQVNTPTLKEKVQEAFPRATAVGNKLSDKYEATQNATMTQAESECRSQRLYTHLFARDAKGVWQYYGSFIPDDKRKQDNLVSQLQRNGAEYKLLKGNPTQLLTDLRKGQTYVGQRLDKWKANLQKASTKIEKVTGPATATAFAKTINATQVQSGLPRMPISAFGSTNPPSDIKPNDRPFQAYNQSSQTSSGGAVGRPKRKDVVAISNEEYQAYLDAGYTPEQLDSLGIKNKRAPRYQDVSPFGPGVIAYRPIGYYQSFLLQTPQGQDHTRSEFQKRLDSGESWRPYNPPVAQFSNTIGTKDEFGNRQTAFVPKFIGAPDQFGQRNILIPPVISIPFYNPMKIEYDAFGQPKKSFWKPPTVGL